MFGNGYSVWAIATSQRSSGRGLGETTVVNSRYGTIQMTPIRWQIRVRSTFEGDNGGDFFFGCQNSSTLDFPLVVDHPANGTEANTTVSSRLVF